MWGQGTIYKYHITSQLNGYEVDKCDPLAVYNEIPPRTASIVWELDYIWGDQEWIGGSTWSQPLRGSHRDLSPQAAGRAEDHRAPPRQGGGDPHGRVDRRADLARGRRPLDAVPQGPEGDELVLHPGLGHDVRLPQPGDHWRLPGDVLPPVGDRAYESARYITNDVFLGEFVRGMHKWGSSVMVILIFLHMARTFFFGAYKYPRELNWVIGVVLLILTFVMSFTGYLLPFDQRSYWATIVGDNINGIGRSSARTWLTSSTAARSSTRRRCRASTRSTCCSSRADRGPDRGAPLPRGEARHHGAAVAEGRGAREARRKRRMNRARRSATSASTRC